MGDTDKRHRAVCQRKVSKTAPSQAGMYLLEYGVILFGVAVFIIGFSDISRIFHARGAVRAGVSEGLRCLYPTDAGCSDQVLANGVLPTSRFNARISGDQTGRFELPRISYSLASSWFNEPVAEASYETKQLASVMLTQPQDAYRQYQVLFPGTAHAVYLLQTQALPRVAAGRRGDAEERVLNPRFIDRETGEAQASNKQLDVRTLSFNTSNVRPGEVGDRQAVDFSIALSDIFPDDAAWRELRQLEAVHGFTAACYQGARTILPNGNPGISWPASGSPSRCAYRNNPAALYDGRALRVPIMIHVTGDGYISPNQAWPEWQGVSAQVELELWQGGVKIAELGGREFKRLSTSQNREFDRQWGNFVVRGAGYTGKTNVDVGQAYREACEQAGYSECRDYINLPLVTVGQPMSLRFRFTWRSENAKPRPDVNVSWQGGRVHIFYPSFSAAHERKGCGFSSNPNSCGTSVAPMQVSYRVTDLDQAFSHEQRAESQCGRSAPTGYQPSIPEALENLRGEIQSGARRLESIAFWSHGAEGDSCSSRTVRISCSESPREYLKGCEPEYELPADAEKVCVLSDYQPRRDLISEPEFSYGESDRVESRGGCTADPFPECAQGDLRDRGSVFLGAVSNGCSSALPINVESFNSGAIFKNTCVDMLAGFIDQYREKHTIPSLVEVRVAEREESPVITREEPSNTCWEHHAIDGNASGSWLCAERASYAVASHCCKMYGDDSCALEEVSRGEGYGGSLGEIIEGARNRVFETVQVAYPPAKMDLTCGHTPDGEPDEDGCIAIQAGPVDNGMRARVQASMRVPLALFDWFGMENHTVVQHEETRALENSLVGSVG